MDTITTLWHRLEETLRAMLHWVESFAGTPHGTWALFLLSFAESSFFPIPPDVLLIALCIGEPHKSLWFALVCTVASVLGGMVGYGIGFKGGRPLLKRFFNSERVAAVQRYYDRYNAWATGIAGLTPLPYKLFTISGGAFAINFKIFVIASILARGARFFAVAGLIYFFGEPIKTFIEEYLNLLSIAFVILLVLGFWLVKRGAGRASRGEQPASAPEEAVEDNA
jgi:membrane protein YqaA with SNARE-associated domain